MEQRTGRLSVRVYTTQAELPLEGSTVAVLQNGEGVRYRLLSLQTTDSSGRITSVDIPAPAAEESIAPGAADGPKCFSVCSVWAEHPGYAMLQVDGVQIFPGVETVQNMELTPLERGQSSLQQRTVRDIPAQDL